MARRGDAGRTARSSEDDLKEPLPDVESATLSADDMVAVVTSLHRWEADGTWSGAHARWRRSRMAGSGRTLRHDNRGCGIW